MLPTSASPHPLAQALRAEIIKLLGIPETSGLVLTPGSLLALQLLFARLGVRRLLMSDQEYYRGSQFVGLDVATCSVDNLETTQRTFQPDAVILSVGAWRGGRLPVESVFRALRHQEGSPRPLLIADCSHSGAAGFPEIGRLECDAAFGDPACWITPAVKKENLGYLWLGTEALQRAGRDAFSPFFLALEHSEVELQSRWIDPRSVKDLLGWLQQHDLSRADLFQRHEANMALARTLAPLLRMDAEPQTALLFTDDLPNGPLVNLMRDRGLAWAVPGGGTRVMCRADLVPEWRKLVEESV